MASNVVDAAQPAGHIVLRPRAIGAVWGGMAGGGAAELTLGLALVSDLQVVMVGTGRITTRYRVRLRAFAVGRGLRLYFIIKVVVHCGSGPNEYTGSMKRCLRGC